MYYNDHINRDVQKIIFTSRRKYQFSVDENSHKKKHFPPEYYVICIICEKINSGNCKQKKRKRKMPL
jgi:hypothetical protein